MKKNKKKLCYIGYNELSCQYILEQLMHHLMDYIEIKIWCTSLPYNFSDYQDCDIYLTANKTVLRTAYDYIPEGKIIIIADRTINTDNLDKLFGIDPGTKVLVIGPYREAAEQTIDIMKSFGIIYLDFVPFYPEISATIMPQNASMAITTGQSQSLVPFGVNETVELGPKAIDLSTIVELIYHLNGVTNKIVNSISHDYISAIFDLSAKQSEFALLNKTLKRKLEVILDTVDQAIVAIDESHKIVVINPVAEKTLGLNKNHVLDKLIKNVLPQIDFLSCFESREGKLNEIKQIKNNYFLVTTNPIIEGENVIGVVVTFQPVDKVKEMELKVRRELKNKGNISKYYFKEIVGDSEAINTTITLAKKFSLTELTVLLEGESGTGKELFAQAIHNHSSRKNGSFVALNFAALPESLVESELFGYEEGSFTGAKRGGKAGLFEEAHQGTIFLDEIGDAPLDVQKKLLRVLEEREVRRVGSSFVTSVDVRVIAATNRSLDSLVKRKEFRKDLFYRLCTLPIYIPPLHRRRGDVFLLITHFAENFYQRELLMGADLEEYFVNYAWPGNIRELQNLVKYLCNVVESGEKATLHHLPKHMWMNDCYEKDSIESQQKIAISEDDSLNIVMIELDRKSILDPIIKILHEFRKTNAINKRLGWGGLVERLEENGQEYPIYKIKKWLKILREIGYLETGRTKQGSKITLQGDQFLTYAEAYNKIME